MVKNIMKSSFMGVSIALIIFSIVGLVLDITNGGSFHMENHQYTKMMIGSIVVGLGFGIPSFIYENDKVPYPIQVIFHMGIGCAVMLVTAFVVGWIPTDKGIIPIVVSIVGEGIVAFVLWKLFSISYKKETDTINKKLKSMKE